MPTFVRHFCIGLCVAILAALNLHGVVQVQHSVAHAADWPAVALADTDADHHDAHMHVAPSDAPDSDTGQDADREQPLGHHQHGAADANAALPVGVRGLTEGPASTSGQRHAGLHYVLSGLPGDGPEYPPKRIRTVI